jgi:short-chain Z-isoprenyl diphosphate synthase
VLDGEPAAPRPRFDLDQLRELLHEAAASGESARELAARLTVEDIAGRLDTAGHPEPDLIIRTSGEQRMSNFLLWQSTHAQLHFCDTYRPAFREIDFLRALRGYAARQRSRAA